MDRRMTTVLDAAQGERFYAVNADCVEFAAGLPDNSIGFSVYSPPFANLFVYSDSERDMGNVADEAEFKALYAHMVREKFRATKPGRLTAVHCSDIPRTKGKHGSVGLYDFPADIREVHEAAGWTYHSRITVWKDPVVEMQRTKALGLLYKQIQTDSTRSRQGMPDYVLVFRKTPEDEAQADKVGQDKALFPVSMWQQWASPVWMDIDQTDVLNVKVAREDKDERHLCPLQLDLIERCVRLWTNPEDTVFSPFMGIGSEGWASLKAGRRFVGSELKPAYFRQAVKNLSQMEAESSAPNLLALAGVA
ncbi:DNA-methyltransferase [Brevundimonas sp. CEF1]|uniref:DNA-methyltransferase n=1 Tax=Brevundimonas sp. CEF1 TaxID=3442642 RepID=UPI003F511930